MLGLWLAAAGWFLSARRLDVALRSFDLESGQQLWRGELPASARSTLMTCSAPSRKQYVGITAGGYEAELGKSDNAVVAFALP